MSATGRAYSVLLALATFTLILSLSGAAVVLATYEGRAARDGARSPVVAAPAVASVWWSWEARSIGHAYVDVIHIEPLVRNAPLPPGLDEWPAPGEVVASPAVVGHVDFDRWVAQIGWSKGRLVGAAGLTDEAERLVYHRPAGPTDRDAGHLVSGFGQAHGVSDGMIGSALRTKPVAVFLEAYSAFVLLPALVLLLAAVRVDGRRRNARLAVLRVLGASVLDRVAFVWGAASSGLLFGLAGAVGVLGAALSTDVTVPVVGYELRASDLRSGAGALVASVLLAVVIIAAVVFTANRGRLSRETRVAEARRLRMRPAVAVLCPVLTWVAVLAYTQAVPYGPNVTTLTYYLGVLVVAATLPLLVAGAMTGLAHLVAGWAHRRGRVATMVAARQILFDARGVLTIGAALAVVVLLSVQVQMFAGKLSAQAVEAAALQEVTGTQVLDVDLRGSSELRAAARQILERRGELLLYSGSPDPGDATVHVTGRCEALRVAGLACDGEPARLLDMTRETRAIAGVAGGQAIEVTVREAVDALVDVPGGWWSGVAIVSSGPALDPNEINTELAVLSTPASIVSPVSESWQVAAQDAMAKSAWLIVFGWCTVALLALALGAAALSEYLDVTRATQAWSALGASGRTVAALNGWRIAFPMLLSVACGVVMTVWLAQPLLLPSQGGRLPVLMLVGIAAVGSAVAGGVWGAATYVGIRDMRRWVPGVTR
ncbi:hypothetical protein [Cellulomonas iranensis]|uniref:hypothetical protein n=1 Tax=Cellulomonas iranensis TaxID=76862 RepID=UPI0013CF7961|nr:hypothetical protein [Cellulomonas iranensis]